MAARFERKTAELWGCRTWWDGVVRLAPCVLGVVGHLSARGEGANVAARSTSAMTLAAGVAARVELRAVDWFAITGTAAASVHISRPRVFVEDLGELYQVPLVGGSFALALEWIF